MLYLLIWTLCFQKGVDELTRAVFGHGNRIRHKRCDEAKPICSNCQNTARVCDGYIDPETGQRFGGHPRGTSVVPCPQHSVPRASHPFVSQQEAQGFRYFELAATAQRGNTLNDNSWIKPTLQIAHRNPAMRQAFIAVGMMTRRYEINEVSVPKCQEDVDLVLDAQKHYFKGVAELRRHTNATPEATQICHSFLGVFQFLQGNPHGMLHHLRDAVQSVADNPNPSELQQKFQAIVRLKDMAMTLWLNLDRALSSPEMEFQDLFTNPQPLHVSTNTTLEALGEDLTRIANEIMTFRHVVAYSRGGAPDDASNPRDDSTGPASAAQVKEILRVRLGLWYTDFLRASAQTSEHDQSFRRPLLHANYLMLVLSVDQVKTYASPPGHVSSPTAVLIVAKHNTPKFAQIIDLATEAWATGGPTQRYDSAGGEQPVQATGFLPLYAFRISFIRPLFYVAQRAPSISLRWRAVQFLLSKPWREGAWDSTIMGTIAKSQLASDVKRGGTLVAAHYRGKDEVDSVQLRTVPP
jgi:hypothetical protein